MKKIIGLLFGISMAGAAIAEDVTYQVTFADGTQGNLVEKPDTSGADYAKTKYHYMNTQEGPDVQADHVYILDDPKDPSRKQVVMVREKQQMGRVSALGDKKEAPQTKVTEKANRTVSKTYCSLNAGQSCKVSMSDGVPDTGKPFATITRTK